MDKTLLICASSRKMGNSHSIIKHLHTSLPKARVLFLSDYHIMPCIDCKACIKNNVFYDNCIHDEVENNGIKYFFNIMQEAKTIFIVSPIYFYNAPSQLKALIDRSQRFWHYKKNKQKVERKIFSIYSAGRQSGEKIPQGVDMTLKYFAPMIDAEFIKSLCLYGLEDENDFANSTIAQGQVADFIEYCKNYRA